jgi:large subunit ribosomal protein L31
MKKDIHPKFHKKSKVTCACGNTFVTSSTLPEIKVEICNKCHPIFTGKQKLINTKQSDKFEARQKKTEALKKQNNKTNNKEKIKNNNK